MITLQTVCSIALVAVLACAVWTDQRHRRIPNALSGALLAFGLITHTTTGGGVGLAQALGGAGIGLGMFLPLYLMRSMAAGDLKLMAAVGAVLGPTQALAATCMAAICGAGIGVILIAHHVHRTGRSGVVSAMGMRFPFASAIAIGTSFVLMLRGSV